MISKSIGLDIGLKKIKAVALSHQNNGFFLDAFSVFPAPPRGMVSQAPLDEEEMAKALKKAVEGLKTNTKNVNIALSDNQVYTKVIEMPVLSDKELALAIYWEAERYIPVALSNISLVWTVLKKPNESSPGEKMQVLMVGAPTVLVDKYQRVLEMAGLNLNSIETEALAIVRALVTPNMPLTIIVNIGAANTSLAIIRNGILALVYSLQTGGNAINRSIEADFGLTSEQSEEYKKTYGFSNEGAGKKIGKSTKPILAAILMEIKKAIAFYSQKYKNDAMIQQVLLSGGTARLPGIDLFFAQNLGIKTMLANPWKSLTNQNLPPEIVKSTSDFTIALGLAERGI